MSWGNGPRSMSSAGRALMMVTVDLLGWPRRGSAAAVGVPGGTHSPGRWPRRAAGVPAGRSRCDRTPSRRPRSVAARDLTAAQNVLDHQHALRPAESAEGRLRGLVGSWRSGRYLGHPDHDHRGWALGRGVLGVHDEPRFLSMTADRGPFLGNGMSASVFPSSSQRAIDTPCFRSATEHSLRGSLPRPDE